MAPSNITAEEIPTLLANDIKVKVAGIDCDGILRGKVMSKDKFLGIVEKGFGFSSAVFGWDMQDVLYTTDAKIAPADSGYVDFIAIPDLNSFRRIPWEDDIPFFLVRFVQNDKPVSADGRSMLKSICDKLAANNCQGMAGVELEFMNFQTPSEDGYGANASQTRDIAAFLDKNAPGALRPLTAGSFSYSATRPVAFKKYFYDIFDTSARFNCGIEGWHTEGGPGVYEATGPESMRRRRDGRQGFSLQVCGPMVVSNPANGNRLLAKSIGVEHGITPCFMAKPMQGQPGSSGHIHVSLCDLEGKNLFARDTPDTNAPWPDAAGLSDLGRQFLAGVLEALPDIMPLFAPTINSYKRLVENFWAPVNISWGLEDRMASVRIITPPVCKPGATRFEVRIPGADLHPHYALSVILAAGWRGVEKKLEITVPPVSALKSTNTKAALLPNTLEEALRRFNATDSIAREILDPEFVEFFTATREHELRVWREAVTDWEFKRYIETV
ncbi:glutamine synthetase family protein [Aspergillus ibericus CBS 121593]|uniref:Glutamine synthetase n=1 Tax=Aspergillus ibericus CBS 121593 TaxID=1448316 RepID=A0A395GN95_9EURO|nr:glutamine synthetase [Aspergillus ibericus CBS 121593]RAK96980.1 glutamine synthetase [Aspergillus ibericus CBS 121593]